MPTKPDFYIPNNKRELIALIKRQYWINGQTTYGLEQKPKKQLYAIYYNIRKNIAGAYNELINKSKGVSYDNKGI